MVLFIVPPDFPHTWIFPLDGQSVPLVAGKPPPCQHQTSASHHRRCRRRRHHHSGRGFGGE